MLYVGASTAAGGTRSGVASSLGIALGAMIHTTAAALGVSTVVAKSPVMFTAIRLVGAAYLAYLGTNLIRSRPSNTVHPTSRIQDKKAFLKGVTVNILNPKVTLFFLAFLPQFVDPVHGRIALQILFLGTAFNAMGTTSNVAVALGMGTLLRGPDHGRKHRMRVHRRMAGCVLIALGIALLLANQ